MLESSLSSSLDDELELSSSVVPLVDDVPAQQGGQVLVGLVWFGNMKLHDVVPGLRSVREGDDRRTMGSRGTENL